MATPALTLSSARQKLFGLFETVTSRQGRKVIITSRGSADQAVLVGERYLDELESAAKRLRDLQAGRGLSAEDFRLFGSGQIHAQTDDPVAAIRAEAQAGAEKKLASLSKDA
jgi:PHD/YefM family antitoxin component YafN of YafNO toxin-antitoxin module